MTRSRTAWSRTLVHGAAVVVALVVAVGHAASASAAVIYLNLDPDQVLQTSTFIWDVDNDGDKDLILDQQTNCVGNCQTIAGASALSGGIVMASATDIAPLGAGATIGPGSVFGLSGLMASDNFSGNPPITSAEEGLWDDGLTAFLGFSFQNPSGTHYGWARVKVDETSNVITVFDAAYDDAPDTAILTPVPEPATFALLLAGAAGVVARRARRRAV